MDAFEFPNVKAEKAKAMLRYNHLRTMAKLFRLVEICLALILFSWISARIPFSFSITGEYFRRLIAIVLSPLFIFVVGNAIVIALLAYSGKLTGQTSSVNCVETDLYEEFIGRNENGVNYGSENSAAMPEPEEIVFHDKRIMITEVHPIAPKSNEVAIVADAKTFRRSESENSKIEASEKACGRLRRSETEKCRKFPDSGEFLADIVGDLSDEEFNRTVEEFIAKQVKFHQEEKLAIIVTC